MCHTSWRKMKGRHPGLGQFSLLGHHCLPKTSIPSRANDCGHVWSDLRLNVGDLGAGSDSDRSCSLLTFLLMMAMTKNTCPIFFYRYAVPVGCTDQFVKLLRSQKLHVVMYSTFLMLCITSFMVFWSIFIYCYTVASASHVPPMWWHCKVLATMSKFLVLCIWGGREIKLNPLT